jgi:hypothetical protein
MNTVDALIITRAKIQNPEDWCKYYATDPSGRHCAIGAFDAAGILAGSSGDNRVGECRENS